VGAGDASLMQMQLRERVCLRCGETVRLGATQDTARPDHWLRRKRIARAVVEEGTRKDLFGSETEK
jgi:hypothetical protein